MSKLRVSRAGRKASSSGLKPSITPQEISRWFKSNIKREIYIGLSLSGGKTDKTALAILEYYPQHKKIFLSDLVKNIKNSESLSVDKQIIRLIQSNQKRLKLLAVNAPLKLPKCMRCRLRCPGHEACSEKEIKWMRDFYKKKNKNKKPKKIFTPYTERCTELFVSSELEEAFHPPHALGANMAPIAARAHYLSRQIKASTIEVNPKVSLWRIGRSLGVQKSYLRSHKHAVSGKEARAAILQLLVESDKAFLYQQDIKLMVENNHAFEAFICALTAVLKAMGQVEPKPKTFPSTEAWVELPVQTIDW